MFAYLRAHDAVGSVVLGTRDGREGRQGEWRWCVSIPLTLYESMPSISPRPHCMDTDQATSLRSPSKCAKRPVCSCVSQGRCALLPPQHAALLILLRTALIGLPGRRLSISASYIARAAMADSSACMEAERRCVRARRQPPYATMPHDQVSKQRYPMKL